MTSSCSSKRFCGQIVTTVLRCSLLLLASSVWGFDYGNALEQIESATSDDAKRAVLSKMRADPGIDALLRETIDYDQYDPTPEYLEDAIEAVRVRAALETEAVPTPPSSEQTREKAAQIKKNPFYKDRGTQSSSWFASAMDQLGELLRRLFSGRREPREFNPPASVSGLGDVVRVIAWVIIGIVLVTFAYFAIRYFAWKQKLRRRASALLDEDEPERTLDEWLELADQFMSEGRHREAIRCLYIACLLRFDQSGIARFYRGQTNWEHLRRIEASPQLPRDIEFRRATRLFDNFWYGHAPCSEADSAWFRAEYQRLTYRLEEVAA
ncbi:MAG: DUF4129 domain-containing protein [Armatimonadetes bacterium]|nr:MAG: DUF4129 domain-containing protein [Armatimonadota bacterium]